MNPPEMNGWTRAEEYVRAELGRLADGQDKVLDMVTSLREDVAALKVKAGIWGAVAGLAAAAGFKVFS